MAEKEVSLNTNLYDLNKDMVERTCKAMSASAIKKTLEQVGIPYFSDHIDNKYFMLLCHEWRDYTVFKFPIGGCYQSMFNELQECFKNRGELYSIERTADKEAIEFWVRVPDIDGSWNMRCYYLFPYDNGVIEVG